MTIRKKGKSPTGHVHVTLHRPIIRAMTRAAAMQFCIVLLLLSFFAVSEVSAELTNSGRQNGTLVPPTLRLLPGDFVQLTIYNSLVSATNVHFHGLRVSPLPGGDNVLMEILPYERTRYGFQIPLSHPSGTFWCDFLRPEV